MKHLLWGAFDISQSKRTDGFVVAWSWRNKVNLTHFHQNATITNLRPKVSDVTSWWRIMVFYRHSNDIEYLHHTIFELFQSLIFAVDQVCHIVHIETHKAQFRQWQCWFVRKQEIPPHACLFTGNINKHLPSWCMLTLLKFTSPKTNTHAQRPMSILPKVWNATSDQDTLYTQKSALCTIHYVCTIHLAKSTTQKLNGVYMHTNRSTK